MIGIEVSVNRKKQCTAGLSRGIVAAKLQIRNQVDPIWFTIDERDAETGGHTQWFRVSGEVGDEFTLKLVNIESLRDS
jgi:hypothetical protein